MIKKKYKKLLKLQTLNDTWENFKLKRDQRKEFGHKDEGYLTMIQREAMLDDIFKLVVG